MLFPPFFLIHFWKNLRADHRKLANLPDVCLRETNCFSSSEGATEVELNDIEAQIGCRLPDDYRCSYRIHNGQKLVIPGSVCV